MPTWLVVALIVLGVVGLVLLALLVLAAWLRGA
jgi:hypothetical protein